MYRAVAWQVETVRAKELTVGESVVGFFADIRLLELFVVDIELVDVCHCEFSRVDLLAMEHTELSESSCDKGCWSVDWHAFTSHVVPVILLGYGYQVIQGHLQFFLG